MDVPFDLARFVRAQSREYDTAIGELRAGEKRSHWMWFILGDIDALKLRSSLTLFQAAAPGDVLFSQALDRFYHGEADPQTLKMLA